MNVESSPGALVIALPIAAYEKVDRIFKDHSGIGLPEFVENHPEEALRFCHGINVGIAQQGNSHQSIVVEDGPGNFNRFNREEDGDVSMQFLKERKLDPLLTETGVERDLVILVSRPPRIRDILRGKWRNVLEEKARTRVKLTKAITAIDFDL